MALLFIACTPPQAPENNLISVGEILSSGGEDTPLLETRRTTFDPEALPRGERGQVTLRLPRETIELTVSRVAPQDLGLGRGQSAWVGRGEDGAEFFFLQTPTGYEAQLTRGSRVYRLRSMDGEQGVLEIFDARRFREPPNDGVEIPETRDPAPSGDSSCLDPADRVDIMVLYTPEARDASGGVAQIENEVAFAIGTTNLAYSNSGVNHRLNLVYTGLANYNEPSGGVPSNDLLGDLQDPSDGVLDTVHGTRDGVQADLVSLIYEADADPWCGWGYTVENADADSTDIYGFSVVRRSCASSNFTFPHEVGHNLGARHDRDNAGTSSLGYNFAHIEPAPSGSLSPWRTLMAYSNPCGDMSSTGYCQRVAWHSNPDVSRDGDPTGVALTATEPEHNVEALAQNDGQVSKYRCLRQDISGADVWMKDRWEDQGREPDPATAGKSMWQSPYIWVRNSEDTALQHEHEHEDPRLGMDNHVYVKAHNDGTASQSGDLELYFASASTNLNDPANWTQIGSQSLSLAPGLEVTHFTWSSLPGDGHYCLLARWNEDSSPLSFTSLGDAVRGDNDLIWRNVNIIGLSGDIDDSAGSFSMAGHPRFRETFLVLETSPKDETTIGWPNLVRVSVTVGSEYLSDGEFSARGVEPLGQGRYALPLRSSTSDGQGGQSVAVIGPFLIPEGESAEIDLDFEVEQEQLQQTRLDLANPAYFDITASQVSAPRAQTFSRAATDHVVLGGVTFTLEVVPADR